MRQEIVQVAIARRAGAVLVGSRETASCACQRIFGAFFEAILSRMESISRSTCALTSGLAILPASTCGFSETMALARSPAGGAFGAKRTSAAILSMAGFSFWMIAFGGSVFFGSSGSGDLSSSSLMTTLFTVTRAGRGVEWAG